MLELTKVPRTDGMVAMTVVVPAAKVEAVTLAIEEAAGPNVSIEEAFPEKTPGMILRGARGLREMTQVQLATQIGVRATIISDMENNRRPIGKAMARKLGEALGFSYKTFL